MKNLTNRQLIKEFNKFLRENECASKFYVALYKRHPRGKIKTLAKYVEEQDWVFNAFTWADTPNGLMFWKNIHYKWMERF